MFFRNIHVENGHLENKILLNVKSLDVLELHGVFALVFLKDIPQICSLYGCFGST
jgi:hypothetical protein